MLIHDLRDLQSNLIDMIDFARIQYLQIMGDRDPSEDHFTDDEWYQLGRYAGQDEAAGAIYLAVFGGKAYGELLDLLMQKQQDSLQQ